MSEWQEYRLDDIMEITSSKRIFYSEYVNVGIPFYRSKEIINLFNNQEIQTELFISKQKYEEIERGAYKGLKGWQRDFIKVIPILNAYYNMKNPREKLNDMINRIG